MTMTQDQIEQLDTLLKLAKQHLKHPEFGVPSIIYVSSGRVKGVNIVDEVYVDFEVVDGALKVTQTTVT